MNLPLVASTCMFILMPILMNLIPGVMNIYSDSNCFLSKGYFKDMVTSDNCFSQMKSKVTRVVVNAKRVANMKQMRLLILNYEIISYSTQQMLRIWYFTLG